MTVMGAEMCRFDQGSVCMSQVCWDAPEKVGRPESACLLGLSHCPKCPMGFLARRAYTRARVRARVHVYARACLHIFIGQMGRWDKSSNGAGFSRPKLRPNVPTSEKIMEKGMKKTIDAARRLGDTAPAAAHSAAGIGVPTQGGRTAAARFFIVRGMAPLWAAVRGVFGLAGPLSGTPTRTVCPPDWRRDGGNTTAYKESCHD